jgi:hypothetical protein
MFQDKNRVVAPPVTPKGRGRRPDPKFDDLNSEINLKITVELKIFSHFVKFWLN